MEPAISISGLNKSYGDVRASGNGMPETAPWGRCSDIIRSRILGPAQDEGAVQDQTATTSRGDAHSRLTKPNAGSGVLADCRRLKAHTTRRSHLATSSEEVTDPCESSKQPVQARRATYLWELAISLAVGDHVDSLVKRPKSGQRRGFFSKDQPGGGRT